MSANNRRGERTGGNGRPAAGSEAKAAEVGVRVPLGELPEGSYEGRLHVDVHLSRPQAATLRRVLAALNARAARCADGRFVQRGPDVIRWLLDAVADAAAG